MRAAFFELALAIAVSGPLGCRDNATRQEDSRTSASPTRVISTEATAAKPIDGASASAPSTEPIGISIISLLATPERYAGKMVRVQGFVRLEFEGDAVYLHREDHDHGLTRNAIWLSLDDPAETLPKQGYSIVEGVFTPGTGHLGLFGGTISRITRLDLVGIGWKDGGLVR